MSLKKDIFSGIRWTTISTIFAVFIQVLQIAILTRVLDKKDFGLMSLVMVIVGFSQAFLDMGISNAIIHKQEITKKQLSSIYWLNIISGILLFLVVCGIAPLIAKYYSEPELTKLIILTSITFIIQSFSQQFMVLLQKEMRFDQISKIDIINKIISSSISILLAFNGFGVYSLVWGIIAGTFVSTVQYISIGFKEYRPLLVFKINEIKDFIHFGTYQMGERIVNYFTFQLDTLLIGKLLGMESLGIYSIAKQLVMRPAEIFNPIITKVTFPAMAKVQNEISKLKETYFLTINHLSSINFPVYTFIFIFAHDITLILFGTNWLAAVPIIKILSIWGAIRSTGNPIGSLLLARGKAKLGFWWVLGVSFIVVIGIYLGSKWKLIGIAYSLLFLQLILMPMSWYFLVKPLCGAKFIEYNREIIIPALVSIVSGTIVYIIIFSMNIDYVLIKLFIGLFFGFIFSLIFNYFLNKKFLIHLMEILTW